MKYNCIYIHISRDSRSVSVNVSTCTASLYRYVRIQGFRMIGNGLMACASESLQSNAATENALYTETNQLHRTVHTYTFI